MGDQQGGPVAEAEELRLLLFGLADQLDAIAAQVRRAAAAEKARQNGAPRDDHHK
jgi:hypothetical protein